MRQIKNIFRKEFRTYFVSPIAYIVISIFLLVTGWFFFMTFFLYNQADLRNFFALLPITFSFVVPAVTMRLFSEELNIGSYEILLTLPVTSRDVILGKFFASVALIAAMLLPTLAYPITISFLGELDWGPVAGGYIGAILLGAAFSSVGLFASSLTRNQIVAFIIGMAICFALTLVDKMLFFMPQSLLGFFEYLGADFHFQNISKGIIDSRDILYFVSVSFFGLYGAHLVMEGKN
ncbi:Predicted ABC transporter, permease protein [uncultured Desulfobacterium sp.]|uniref:Predicted ABC transporter, permease protein n=1 Tax=uncultured Desulfobacterium sp. TaxID=201089 RepID=A0A445MWJ2_9BACT|nr:Predicted ABC transporter, permease protein [uncultured Desulfobacterium sp.]